MPVVLLGEREAFLLDKHDKNKKRATYNICDNLTDDCFIARP